MTANLPNGYRLVSLDESRLTDVKTLDAWAFPRAQSVEDFSDEMVALEWPRAFGVEADGEPGLVAMCATHTFERAQVPGATAKMGGLSWVGVHPQHRRKGLLKAMMAKHFEDCAAHGEAIAALTASEYGIYGRFGFGVAADSVGFSLPRGAALLDVPGADDLTVRIEAADVERHRPLYLEMLSAVGDTPSGIAGLNRPGWVSREREPVQRSPWLDPVFWRDGGESLRVLTVWNGDEPRGLATFRRRSGWGEDGQPNGKVSVGAVLGLDAAANRALWGALLDFDLTATVTMNGKAIDESVLNLLVNRRAATVKLGDFLWLRLLDLPAALAARQYQADVDVVLGVTDDLLPGNAGNWHLAARAFSDGATCMRTDAPADVTVGIQQLGQAYEGGYSLASFAAAGLAAEKTPGALARTAAAFGWPVPPALSWGF